MSVVVRMEMPKGCLDCPCVNGEYGYCQADKEERQIEDPGGRPSWCPIICSLPEGHGRLVDADALIDVLGIMSDKGGNPVVWMQMRYIAEDMHTIVPAERSET